MIVSHDEYWAQKKAGLAAERLVDEATPQMFSTCGSDKCDKLKE